MTNIVYSLIVNTNAVVVQLAPLTQESFNLYARYFMLGMASSAPICAVLFAVMLIKRSLNKNLRFPDE